ncbi:MAG: LysR family transcriptional regulator [Aeromonas veronii]
MNYEKIPSIKTMRVFESVARHQSIAKAADELFMSNAAVSLQVKKLEVQLGAELFDRLGRGVELNQNGDILYNIVVSLLTDASDNFNRFLDGTTLPILTIQTYVMASVHWLNSRAIEFKKLKNDNLKLIIVTPDEINFNPSIADCAFILERNPRCLHRRFNWKKIFPHAITPICTRRFIDMHGGNLDLSKIKDFPIICTPTDLGDWKKWFSVFCPGVEPSPYITVGDKQIALSIAMQDHGLVLINMPFVLNEIMENILCQPFEETLWDGEWGIIYEGNGKNALLVEDMIESFLGKPR